jgi:thymidylate kinase
MLMVIKIDGIDGCGKSTLLKSLYERLIHKGSSAIIISEFASSEFHHDFIGKQLRSIIESNENPVDEFERELLFTTISRRTNLHLIPNLISKYEFILVDRSEIANYTYGLSISDEYHRLYDAILQKSKIDESRILWLDTPIDICLDRLTERTNLSINETRGYPFFSKVRELFELFSKRNLCLRLDGEDSLENITDKIMDYIFTEKI